MPAEAVLEEIEHTKTEKPTIGWVERIKIYPGGMELKAKIDTGAKSSSINAPNAVTFERDGERWVSFELSDPKKKKKIVKIERKVHRTTLVKRKGDESHERLVIRLFVCLGNDSHEIDVNLADRRGFNYQVLIGRNDIAKLFKVNVDPSEKFMREPRCPPPHPPNPDEAGTEE